MPRPPTTAVEAYPRARKNRGTGVALEQLAGIVAPRMRVFPFFFDMAATRRQSFSLGRCSGPAIIKGIEINPGTGQSPPASTIEIGTSPVPVLETNANLALARPYNNLIELADPFALITGPSGDGLPNFTIPNTHVRYERPLDIVVLDAQFFPVIASINNSAGAASFSGVLRVLEGVNPEAVRFFL